MEDHILYKYKVIIGLEVHAQLLTDSKIFAPDSTEYGELPNTNISEITLGHPGTLPKPNKRALEYAMKMGLACHANITRENIFDRKNYFYPDLPKGYQITQDKTPICKGGYLTIKPKDGIERNIGLNRIHIEEDAGKSIHLEGESDTLVDFNRAGVPLIEIVTQPDIHSPEEAYALLTEIRKLVRYLEICDGNMEEGSMRCDANVSVMLKTAKEFGTKVEVKNMNSIRNVFRAINHEVHRQVEIIENGETILSDTRTFDATTGTTSSMRTKEELNDYRYFPEPDISPVIVSDEWLEEIKASLPSLPHELHEKFVNDYGLPEYDADVLTDTKEIALFFDELCQKTTNYKAASNWVMGPVKSYLNDLSLHIDQFPLTTDKIAELIEMVNADKVSFTIASQNIYPELLKNPDKKAETVAQEKNLIQFSGSDDIQPLIDDVISSYPDKVAAYQNGKKGLLGMFVGEVMKQSKGKANPKVVNELLKKSLEEITPS